LQQVKKLKEVIVQSTVKKAKVKKVILPYLYMAVKELSKDPRATFDFMKLAMLNQPLPTR
jgi:hypothetical protein